MTQSSGLIVPRKPTTTPTMRGSGSLSKRVTLDERESRSRTHGTADAVATPPAKAKRRAAGQGWLVAERSGFLSRHVTVCDAATKVSLRFASPGRAPSALCVQLALAGCRRAEGDGAGQDGGAG